MDEKKLAESLRVISLAIQKAQKAGVYELDESYFIKVSLDNVFNALGATRQPVPQQQAPQQPTPQQRQTPPPAPQLPHGPVGPN